MKPNSTLRWENLFLANAFFRLPQGSSLVPGLAAFFSARRYILLYHPLSSVLSPHVCPPSPQTIARRAAEKKKEAERRAAEEEERKRREMRHGVPGPPGMRYYSKVRASATGLA